MTQTNQLSLGLDDHDRLNQELGGGIPRGAIVLIEGEYGAGKSVLSQRFTHGLAREGHRVTYLSTELEIRGFVEQMHSLRYDVVSDLLDERVLFLHADVSAGTAFGDGAGTKERRQLLRRLMDANAMWSADVIVIDTFDAILRNDPQFEALVRQNDERQAALEIISFFREIVSEGRTIILTVDPSTVDDEAIGPFRSIADVYMELEMVTVGSDVRRHIAVRRFAGMGQQVGDTVGYSVRSGIGIVIESRSVA
jgi:flagellar protein FlaH